MSDPKATCDEILNRIDTVLRYVDIRLNGKAYSAEYSEIVKTLSEAYKNINQKGGDAD